MLSSSLTQFGLSTVSGRTRSPLTERNVLVKPKGRKTNAGDRIHWCTSEQLFVKGATHWHTGTFCETTSNTRTYSRRLSVARMTSQHVLRSLECRAQQNSKGQLVIDIPLHNTRVTPLMLPTMSTSLRHACCLLRSQANPVTDGGQLQALSATSSPAAGLIPSGLLE